MAAVAADAPSHSHIHSYLYVAEIKPSFSLPIVLARCYRMSSGVLAPEG